jgi:hypothetical protein
VCGLQRVGGQLVVGSDGFPLPNCVSASERFCDQPNTRPLPANVTGGNGIERWTAIMLNGTSDTDGVNVGVIAEIGSDPFVGGSTFFTGNGSDSTIAVQVMWHTFMKRKHASLCDWFCSSS